MSKVKRYIVKTLTNRDPTLVHYDGVIQPGDVALCGHDLMGDKHLGWEQGIETSKKVNCQLCLRIVEHVRNIITPTNNNTNKGE